VQGDPHFVTLLALSATEGFFINGIFDVVSVTLFCYKIDKWIMITISMAALLFNYVYYHKVNRPKAIIKKKPSFFSSAFVTKIIVLLFSILAISWLFWGSYYSRSILMGC